MSEAMSIVTVIAKRLLLLVTSLWVLSIVLFLALRVLPGDAASVIAGTKASAERIAAVRARLGLDRSLLQQYVDWLASMARGNLGNSIMTGQSVSSIVAKRAAISVPIMLCSILIALAIGVPLGACCAITAYSQLPAVRRVSEAIRAIMLAVASIPALWLGLVLIALFGQSIGVLHFFPVQGFPSLGWSTPFSALASIMLPSLCVGVIVAASIMRYTSASLMSPESQGFITAGMMQGLSRRQATVHIGLRLALSQLVAVVGITVAQLLTGTIVVEKLFALPGFGSGLVTDVANRDLQAALSELMLLAGVFIVIGCVIDLLHKLADPRMRES